MPRLMSFSATLDQFRDRTKTVTRRRGWAYLEPGEILEGIEKGMGLKLGEKAKRMGLIRVLSVRREQVSKITPDDLEREGFGPTWTVGDFVKMYCRLNACAPGDLCTRIEFEYVD